LTPASSVESTTTTTDSQSGANNSGHSVLDSPESAPPRVPPALPPRDNAFRRPSFRSSVLERLFPETRYGTTEVRTYEGLQQLIDRVGVVSRGATADEIASLPTQVYRRRVASSSSTSRVAEREAEKCPICLCEYEEGSIIKRLPCMHTFCSECIGSWLQSRAECPCCKATIKGETAVSRGG
jgi:hypothetical protein